MADTIVKSDWQKLLPIGFYPQQNSNIGNAIAAAATIAPSTYFTEITGTTQVSTITPPYTGFAGTICLVFTDASPGATLTSGNIALATTVVRYKALFMTYNPITSKWYPSY
jgi:hypothetical protein